VYQNYPEMEIKFPLKSINNKMCFNKSIHQYLSGSILVKVVFLVLWFEERLRGANKKKLLCLKFVVPSLFGLATDYEQWGYVVKMPGYKRTMLHFEMYSKKATGPLTNKQNPPYKRRSDLIDPTQFLNKSF